MADERPLITVIVLCYNGMSFLPRCLSSLYEQKNADFDLVVVDNLSADDSVAWLRSQYPDIPVIQMQRNSGYSAANNAAARQAKGQFLFFLNMDTHLHPQCLAAFAQAIQDPDCAPILGCTQRDYDGNRLLSAGVGMDFMGYPCLAAGKPFYADGAALLIRADVFEALGGFDEYHFMFYEDVDLCWRARLMGYSISIVHGAIVYHWSGGAAEGGMAKGQGGYRTTVWRRYLGERNALHNIIKNYSAWMVGVVLPIYLSVNLIEMTVLLLTGNRRVVTGAYLKAWEATLKSLPRTLRQRRQVQKSRVISDWKLLKCVRLVPGKWQAFRQTGLPTFSS